MTSLAKDPLIAILRAILMFFLAVLVIALAGIVAGAVILPFVEGKLAAGLAEKDIAMSAWQVIALAEIALVGGFILAALAGYFLVLLWRILASVQQGDPFVPENADRLSRMAWISLTGNVLAFFLGIYGAWLATVLPADEKFNLSFDFGAGGPLLILVLFVLARVFRHGTALRADLEGTV